MDNSSVNNTYKSLRSLKRSLPERPYNPLYDGKKSGDNAPKFNRLYLVPIMCLLIWTYLNLQKKDDIKVEPELTQVQKIRNNRAIFNEDSVQIGELGSVNDPHIYNTDDAFPNGYDVNSVKNPAILTDAKTERRANFRKKRPVLSGFLDGVDSVSNKLVFAGSFANKDNAERVLNRLKSIGYNKAEIIMKEKLPYQVVVTGFYNHDNSAKAEVRSLEKRGIDVYSATKNLEEIYRLSKK
jgi:SPOR domain